MRSEKIEYVYVPPLDAIGCFLMYLCNRCLRTTNVCIINTVEMDIEIRLQSRDRSAAFVCSTCIYFWAIKIIKQTLGRH